MNYDNGFPGSNGIGIDADTALVVQADGSAQVLGQFNVYFVTAASMPDPFGDVPQTGKPRNRICRSLPHRATSRLYRMALS